MKSLTVNNTYLNILFTCTLFVPLMAHAHIENTVVADYDLSTGKSTHYELLISKPGKESIVTIIPEGNNNTPSIFKVSTCINRIAGTAKEGEFRFNSADADKNDLRLSNISYFVNEHNLRAWWIHLNTDQTLMFNTEVGGLIVSDPKTLNPSTDVCKPD